MSAILISTPSSSNNNELQGPQRIQIALGIAQVTLAVADGLDAQGRTAEAVRVLLRWLYPRAGGKAQGNYCWYCGKTVGSFFFVQCPSA